MGKGDQRTRRGKLYRGTFGKSRPHKANKGTVLKGPENAVARAAAARKAARKASS